MAIEPVGRKCRNSCGTGNIGAVGVPGGSAPKSIVRRLLRTRWLFWLLMVVVVLTETVELFRTCALGSCVAMGDFAIGKDMPRSFPRLATPTPHVRVVRYPEHSFPFLTHCSQYGRRWSHFTPSFLHAKQSTVALVAGVFLVLLFLGAETAAVLLVAVVVMAVVVVAVVVVAVVVVAVVVVLSCTSADLVVGDMAMVDSIKYLMLLQYSTVLHLQDVDYV
jgi:hypothetical protein